MEAFVRFVIILAFGVFIAILLAYPTMWVINYVFSASLLTFVFGSVKIGLWKAFWVSWLFSRGVSSSPSSKESK